MSEAPSQNPWIGRAVGDRQRYRIAERLGGGGMGDVFLAIDTILGQEVAIKMLKDRLLGEGDLRRRFEREVLLCAAIRSDNVVQVKDYGTTDEGYPFYVMEYLQGQTLGQLLRREQRLSVERVLGIFHQVCAGLHLAHQGVVLWDPVRGNNEIVQVVHRDLKPENIFLVPTTLGELVKVLDFGIAKVASSQFGATSTGTFMGTFQYAAPEQLEARRDLDERADIYSLGMMLYEALSGTDPFGCRDRADDNSGLCWIRAHTSQAPTPLRSQPGCGHISEALETAVLRCLAKSPQERFASVKALDEALQDAAGVCLESPTVARTVTSRFTSERPSVPLAPTPASAPPPAEPLSPTVRDRLERLLAGYIGPIAPLLLGKALDRVLTFSEIVDRLEQHVPSPQQTAFRRAAMQLVEGEAPLRSGVEEGAKRGTNPTTTKPNAAPTTGGTSPSAPGTVNAAPDLAFVGRCERELADLIGPMARLVVRQALGSGQTTVVQLVDAIANQLPDPKQANEFRKRLMS